MHDGARTLIFDSIEKEQFLTAEDAVDLNDFSFKLAFSAHNYLHPMTKYDDPSLVEWYLESIESDGIQDIGKQILKYHKCNVEDFKQFYPPARAIKHKIEMFKENKNLFCIDDEDIDGNPVITEFFG